MHSAKKAAGFVSTLRQSADLNERSVTVRAELCWEAALRIDSRWKREPGLPDCEIKEASSGGVLVFNCYKLHTVLPLKSHHPK